MNNNLSLFLLDFNGVFGRLLLLLFFLAVSTMHLGHFHLLPLRQRWVLPLGGLCHHLPQGLLQFLAGVSEGIGKFLLKANIIKENVL